MTIRELKVKLDLIPEEYLDSQALSDFYMPILSVEYDLVGLYGSTAIIFKTHKT